MVLNFKWYCIFVLGGNMENSSVNENKMGTMPVNKLLLSMAIPIMISMIVQAFYNVVDSIYVSQLSEDARLRRFLWLSLYRTL